jgi:hypothetical protein
LCWELEGEETSANIEIIDIYYFYGVHPRRASWKVRLTTVGIEPGVDAHSHRG